MQEVLDYDESAAKFTLHAEFGSTNICGKIAIHVMDFKSACHSYEICQDRAF